MNLRILLHVAAALALGSIDLQAARADEPKPNTAAAPSIPVEQARAAIARGLTFLDKDAVKWRAERGCATCHHGTMTVWALGEAQAQGYAVSAESFVSNLHWTKERFVPRLQAPRDPRPGWNLVSVPAIYLGMMSHNLPVLSRAEINDVAVHLARHQEDDGAWIMPPASNGAPPIWESRETVALLALMAWEPYVPADPKLAAEAGASRAKAVAWLAKSQPTETTQASTLRLLMEARLGKTAPQLHVSIERLLRRQNADGGWSQAKELASDAFATGQALYALSCAGVRHDEQAVQRAVAFLTKSQKEDGSWPMTSRSHVGVESKRTPIRNPVPITYFGSAWASIGLVRSVPAAADSAPKQQLAFNLIRSFHGKFDVDEKAPDRPVVRVDLRYYEVSDQEVATFTKALQAFPKLATLQFRSSKITDAGLAHLKELPRLQSVALENASITDAGLGQLKTMSELRQLDLKGAKVTDAGIAEFRKASPKATVQR